VTGFALTRLGHPFGVWLGCLLTYVSGRIEESCRSNPTVKFGADPESLPPALTLCVGPQLNASPLGELTA
jgi:hypothetical protein